MTPREKELIRSSFSRIQRHADLFAEAFYLQFFSRNPNIALMFRGDMKVQERRLGEMLTTVVSGIDRLDRLRPALRNLGLRHVRYGVKPSDYDAFGESLIWTLERILGERLTPETRIAWVKFYDLLSGIMQGTREWRGAVPSDRPGPEPRPEREERRAEI